MALSVRVLGVGDAFTSRHVNASVIVEADGTRILVDAPPALARGLAALGERGGPRLSLDDIDHVIVTHLHGDHVGGLEQLLFWRRFVTKRKCTVHAIPEVLADLWEKRLAGGMERLVDTKGVASALSLEDYAVVEPLEKGKTRIGSLEVEWRPTFHHIPTSALKLSSGKKAVGLSADTSFDLDLIEWLAASDVFFHETNHGIHTPLASLVALPARLKERMRLIHYPDEHDTDRSPIPCAREGERFDL
ncbi:ribonuclease Z [bacterium]|nr:ribonuclease Z [bacterium]